MRAAVAAHRLVTLTGPGGAGKTRLALAAAAGLLPHYPHGVWLVELAAVADAALVARAVAAAVRVRDGPGRPPPAALAEALRLRHTLLVLDNCEHLVDACARLADALLRACPRVHLLVTSREALGLPGELVWRVPPLAVPPQAAAPGAPGPAVASTRYGTVRLFRDRAVAVQPGFRVMDANALAVAQVCARLDGLPLAIELAAAMLRVLSVEQLLERLDDRFRLLADGRRTVPERHRTLLAAVDWSYALLSDAERTLFARLSVFAGGWTLDAAKAVGAGEEIAAADVLGLLTGLVDQSLVLVDGPPDGTARYRLLETLRQYAQRRLVETGAAEVVHRRHAEHYALLADRLTREAIARRSTYARRVGRLDREHDNLHAALRWATDRADGEPGARLVAGLWQLWYARGFLTEGGVRLDAFVAVPRPRVSGARRVEVLTRAALLARHQADVPSAHRYASAAVAAARAAGDRQNLAFALEVAALAAREAGRYDQARSCLEECLALAEVAGNQREITQVLDRLATVRHAAGDLDAARRLYEESLGRARREGRGGTVTLSGR